MNTRLTKGLVAALTIGSLTFGFATPVFAQTTTGSSLTARAIVALTNTDRASGSVAGITEDLLLDKAAQAKADDMVARGYFSHTDPSGNQPWVWFKKVGYYYWSAGENLAMGFDDAAALNSAWMQSPGHRANIVTSAYTKVGIGIAHGVYKGKETTFVVQFFAKPYVAPTLALR